MGFAFLKLVCAKMRRWEPVSYTHLDVYKRQPFYPDRMAGRILGMGDVLSLIDKAQANLERCV